MRLLWRCVLVVAALAAGSLLAVACEEEEEEEGTPTGTPTVAATSTPTAVAGVPGITDTEIILGSHFAQTGTYGAAYAPILAGLEAYFGYVNAEEGGVCGREIVLKVEDDHYDPAAAVEAVEKLLERDEVFAIVAGLGTAAHSAVWEDLNEQGVPDLWIVSGAHQWAADPEQHPWSVPIAPDYYVEGTVLGKYISENLPGRKVGILYQNDDFGKDVLTGLKDGLDPAMNELVSEQSYEITAVSIRSQVINLQNDGVEVAVGACIPPPCAQFIQEADRLGWDPEILLSYVNSDPMMFTYSSPELMEGIISSWPLKQSDWTDDPAVAEHYRIMDEYGDRVPGNFTIVGQVAGELTVEALSRTCDNLTREALMDAVHSIKDYQLDLVLADLPISLSPTDHLVAEDMMMLRAAIDETGKGKWEYFGEIVSFKD